MRRRQRRLRAQWRHEQQSVAVALAEALHHSAGPKTEKVERRERQEERGQKAPPPGTRPGLPREPAPQVRLEAAARALVVDGLPTLALLVLAGSAGEAIDSGALSFLPQKQLAPVVEEEEEEEAQLVVESRSSGCSSATPLARPITGTAARARPPGTLLRVSRLSGLACATPRERCTTGTGSHVSVRTTSLHFFQGEGATASPGRHTNIGRRAVVHLLTSQFFLALLV